MTSPITRRQPSWRGYAAPRRSASASGYSVSRIERVRGRGGGDVAAPDGGGGDGGQHQAGQEHVDLAVVQAPARDRRHEQEQRTELPRVVRTGRGRPYPPGQGAEDDAGVDQPPERPA